MKDTTFVYLNQQDIRSTGVNMNLAMQSVEDALRLHHQGKTILPYKTVLDLDERQRGRGNAMPAYVGGDYDVFGIKWISGFPQNPAKFALPRGIGLFILNDSMTGMPLAVMDCTELSALRTGAVTGVAAKYLAREDSSAIAIVGSGVQARTQLEALNIALPAIQRVLVFDIRQEIAELFAEEIRIRHKLCAQAVDSVEHAVRNADVIVTVTVADEPIVKKEWLRRGSFFAAVGSYQEEEFDVVSSSDKIVVDCLDHVIHRGTPVIALMLKKEMINRNDIIEIGTIIAGRESGRTNENERIFFSPIGLAVEDVCLCHNVYQIARQKGIGTELDLLKASAQK